MSTKIVALSSIPIRIALALGMVFLGYQLPYVALGILIFGMAIGCIGLAIIWLLRRSFRRRNRIECAKCDYRPLKIARICPKCHTPTLVESIRGLPPSSCDAIIGTAVSMAWADGNVEQQEQNYLDTIIDTSTLSEDRKITLREYVQNGMSISDLETKDLSSKDKEQVINIAASIMVADGVILESEERVYEELVKLFGFNEKRSRRILKKFQRMAWV